MRFRGVHHVEFSVLDYDDSIKFYDKMFGWLRYSSFWTLNVDYLSTYYMARRPFFHSYIGIQPAKKGEPLNHKDQFTGINHIALWARNKREVNRFYQEFLLRERIAVTNPPALVKINPYKYPPLLLAHLIPPCLVVGPAQSLNQPLLTERHFES